MKPRTSISFGDGWAVLEDIGGRVAMEDRYVAGLEIANGFTAFGVFDGHNGDSVAAYCKERVEGHLRAAFSRIAEGSHTIGAALTSAIDALDDAGADANMAKDVGSTACIAVLSRDEVWVANVGDSRAVMKSGGVAWQMSEDHKPALEKESKRIYGHGGYLTNTDGTLRIMGGLNLSRSIGDWSMRPLVISTPTIEHCARMHIATRRGQPYDVVREGMDEYMVIATDGLWDVIPNDLVVKTVDAHTHTRQGVHDALTELLAMSRTRGSTDNVTILYVGMAVCESRGGRSITSTTCNKVKGGSRGIRTG